MKLGSAPSAAIVLAISGGATALVILMMALHVVLRSSPINTILIGLSVYLALPMASLACLIFAGWSLWRKQWLALIAAFIFPAFAAVEILSTNLFWPAIGELVRRVEFTIAKPNYDLKVKQASLPNAQRAVRVSYLDTSVMSFTTQTFEEIWFDETDALGSGDSSIRDNRARSLHPHWGDPSGYSVVALGGHYYRITYWY